MSFKPSEIPTYFQSIPELDITSLLLEDPLANDWIFIGIWGRNNDSTVMRKAVLVNPKSIRDNFSSLDAIGNEIGDLGQPTGNISSSQNKRIYHYIPYYNHRLRCDVMVEPLAFLTKHDRKHNVLLNQDIILFFDLVDRSGEDLVWTDPENSREVLKRTIYNGVERIEIQKEYLLKYIKARQQAILVGHFESRTTENTTINENRHFEEENILLQSETSKATISSLKVDLGYREPYFHRDVHYWFVIYPDPIDIENPWRDSPTFDIYEFTLPTEKGDVAPGRFVSHKVPKDGRRFAGTTCDFMNSVFFNQGVLVRYEDKNNTVVADDGSVMCDPYWGLNRSTRRIGDTYVQTSIGDFAEGLPLEEWPHWKQYAVQYPSSSQLESAHLEGSIIESVNKLCETLSQLNTSASIWMSNFDKSDKYENVWKGTVEGPTAKTLKRVYLQASDDMYFLSRITALNNLVIEELVPQGLRTVIHKIDVKLSYLNAHSGQELRGRQLLERWLLIAYIIKEFSTNSQDIFQYVKSSLQEHPPQGMEPSFHTELRQVYNRARSTMSVLAFLNDFRNAAGIAHSLSATQAKEAAQKLGLPKTGWGRTHYLLVLKKITETISTCNQEIKESAFLLNKK